MKTKTTLPVAFAAALASTVAFGQAPQPPQPPAPPGLPGTAAPYPDVKSDVGRPSLTPPKRAASEHRETQPYLGIVTTEVPPALATQLGLPDGLGLLIDEVIPQSPAAAAGFEKFDILKSFNDQQLINPDQLSTLVRLAGKGKNVSFTLIRKGQERQISAKLGERETPERESGKIRDWKLLPGVPFKQNFGSNPPTPEEKNRWEDLRNRALRQNEEITAEASRLGEKARGDAEQARRNAEEMQERIRKEIKRVEGSPGGVSSSQILLEAQPGGGSRITVFKDDGTTTLDNAKSRLVLTDGDGTIEVAVENGHRRLKASDASGKLSFSGPVDTEEQRQAVPEVFRKKLEDIEIRQKNGLGGAAGASSSVSVETRISPAPGAK